MGQLAAIEVAVLQAMSIRYTHTVYDAWAMPGGAGAAGWAMTANVQAFLAAARMTDELDVTATVVVTPAAGQVKGVDGPDWVVACVLVEVRATITVEARMGYGHCERMQWHQGRWMIAPGTPPARAPSTWPGSERSVQAGWRSWADRWAAGAGLMPRDFGLPNPFKYLAAEAAGKLVADSWTAAMLGLWNAGLWVLRLVLRFVDALLTPDLSDTGPGRRCIRRRSGWPGGCCWS